MGDFTDADYAHTKRVCKDFERKHLGECHDLYVQSNTLLSAHSFENLEIGLLKYTTVILQKHCIRLMASSFKKGQSKIRSFK